MGRGVTIELSTPFTQCTVTVGAYIRDDTLDDLAGRQAFAHTRFDAVEERRRDLDFVERDTFEDGCLGSRQISKNRNGHGTPRLPNHRLLCIDLTHDARKCIALSRKKVLRGGDRNGIATECAQMPHHCQDPFLGDDQGNHV